MFAATQFQQTMIVHGAWRIKNTWRTNDNASRALSAGRTTWAALQTP
jgi:hypothetical protein